MAGRDPAGHDLQRRVRARGLAADAARRRRRARHQGEAARGPLGHGRDYKVHLDGYNLLPYFKGEQQEAPRREFLYWTDGGDLAALRYGQWKVHFLEQRAHGFDVWQEPFVPLRLPKLFNLRGDPFERADEEGIGYASWRVERAFVLVPAQAFVANWLQSFKEFPPRQKAATFGIDQVMDQLTSGGTGND